MVFSVADRGLVTFSHDSQSAILTFPFKGESKRSGEGASGMGMGHPIPKGKVDFVPVPA